MKVTELINPDDIFPGDYIVGHDGRGIVISKQVKSGYGSAKDNEYYLYLLLIESNEIVEIYRLRKDDLEIRLISKC